MHNSSGCQYSYHQGPHWHQQVQCRSNPSPWPLPYSTPMHEIAGMRILRGVASVIVCSSQDGGCFHGGAQHKEVGEVQVFNPANGQVSGKGNLGPLCSCNGRHAHNMRHSSSMLSSEQTWHTGALTPVLDLWDAQPPLKHLQVRAPGLSGLVNEVVIDHVGSDGGMHAADEPAVRLAARRMQGASVCSQHWPSAAQLAKSEGLQHNKITCRTHAAQAACWVC